MMPTRDIAVPAPHHLAEIHRTGDRLERIAAYRQSLALVDDPRANRPIPLFMTAMPWSESDDDVSDQIIAAQLAADDPYAQQDAGKTVSGRDLVGKRVTVHDVRVRASSKDGGWGAYLLLDCTTDPEGKEHQVVTIGAKQAVATLAYAWYAGDLPLTGTPQVVTQTASGNEVLGFLVERDF